MSTATEELHAVEPSDLVPGRGYTKEDVDHLRGWFEDRTGAQLNHVGAYSLDSRSMQGNIENVVGAVQVPLGIAGPLLIAGEQARGVFYVPLATTEGTLVSSYERGMVAMTRAGGVAVRIALEGNRISPVFSFASVERAHAFAAELPRHASQIREIAESTTRHGKLLHVQPRQVGQNVIVDFQYDTADAHGMNMVSKATQAACRWIKDEFEISRYCVSSGGCSEKRASAALFRGGKGKRVTAGLCLPKRIVRRYLHATPTKLHRMWQRTLLAQLQIGTIGYNGHYANGLTAIFIACGQDVANVTNSAVGITSFEVTDEGDLYASVTLTSLTIGTVGGGTALGTSRECLSSLGCAGSGKSRKFAEIIAATILAGELSFGASLADGGEEFVRGHEKYGRNRPHDAAAVGD
jgi:hydroxymethylglutaryl-CoA reductase (NADPH)